MHEQRTTNRVLEPRLERALAVLSGYSNISRDEWGNGFAWFTLKSPDLLTRAATILASCGARLCTVTAYARTILADPENDIAYHFDMNGYTINIVVMIDPIDVSVPTITPWFKNADWNEREFMELYDIHVEGHPNPKRLFLDPRLDEGVLNEAIPLTILMNGASSRDLWERVMHANNIPAGASPPPAASPDDSPASVYQAPGTIPPVAHAPQRADHGKTVAPTPDKAAAQGASSQETHHDPV